jgi:hypothetical protein
MNCNYVDDDDRKCRCTAVRFATLGQELVAWCKWHAEDDCPHPDGRWLFANTEITEREAELWLVHNS